MKTVWLLVFFHLSLWLEASAQADIPHTPKRSPKTEFRQDGLDQTLNQITYLRTVFHSLQGSGMQISIKENLFDTADIDFKNRIGSLEYASSHIDMHATNMATIAAGAGNSAPSAKGVACNAMLSSASFSNLAPEPDPYFLANGISVQSHAYGTGIENFYGDESAAYDEQAARIRWLLHVFSSGNTGTGTPDSGKYAGIAEWANLTGQFKQSKNTMSVGAVDSLDNVVGLSSRGPAYDGRIKPEIVAYGHGGSSGAAALVSGTALLLQELYLNLFGQLPNTSLVKAVMINTARDIGNPGPDFISGFGSLRAFDAMLSIEENRFFESTITQQEMVTFNVQVPPKTATAKFTLAWIDPAANKNTSTALVNDLDICIQDEHGTQWHPWVLSAFPNADSLDSPARKGVDTLNNVEMISVDFPMPGQYTVKISGTKVNAASQLFSLTWDFELEDEFLWTFPSNHDYLVAGSTNLLRWSSSYITPGAIEFRMIGKGWMPITDTAEIQSGFYKWNTPGEEGLYQLRFITGEDTIASDTFVIASLIQPDVGLLCPDSVIIIWRRLPNADSTEIFVLGEKHLEHLAFTRDTFYVAYDPDPRNPYFAFAPVYEGKTGPKSYTIDYSQQGGGCYLNLFYVLYVLDGKAFFGAELSRVDQINQVVLAQRIDGHYVDILTFDGIDSTRLFFESGPLLQGVNEFRLTVRLKNGEEIQNTEIVYFTDGNKLLLFPNPSISGQDITVLTGDIGEFTLRVFDLQGRKALELESLESPVLIPSSTLYGGMFAVQLISDEGIQYSGWIQIYNMHQP